jgi:hypothetical protein
VLSEHDTSRSHHPSESGIISRCQTVETIMALECIDRSLTLVRKQNALPETACRW